MRWEEKRRTFFLLAFFFFHDKTKPFFFVRVEFFHFYFFSQNADCSLKLHADCSLSNHADCSPSIDADCSTYSTSCVHTKLTYDLILIIEVLVRVHECIFYSHALCVSVQIRFQIGDYYTASAQCQ